MSDSSRTTDDAPGNAERLLRALGGAAAELGTREALAEISDRARGLVDELARHARSRREDAHAGSPREDTSTPPSHQADRGRSGAGASDDSGPAELHRRLGELRACVGEVADVLEATVERLETVEHQLGDPDASIERQLADGIHRCERVLMGIEHRVVRSADDNARAAAPNFDADGVRSQQPGRSVLTVLVVARTSRRRSHLCLALERQGLHTLAAGDLALAVRMTARNSPAVALLDVGEWHHAGAERKGTGADLHGAGDLMEEWKEYEERGALPCAAVVEAGGHFGASTFGFETIEEQHGEAAMAACLARLAGLPRAETH